MVSVNYNPAAASAVRVLQSVNRDLEVTQKRLTTGIKVGSARDNPSVWAAAQGLRSEISEKAAIRDAMGATETKAKVAAKGLETAAGLLSDMKSLILQAKDPAATATTKAGIQKNIAELQNQLKSVVSEAQVKGESWLDGTKAAASVVTSFGSSGATTMSIDLSGAALTKAGATPSDPKLGILDKLGTESGASVLGFDVTTSLDLDDALADLETATSAVKTAAATVGAGAKRIEMHDQFLKDISAILEEAVGEMVNADMEEETAKLAALQVRQQLASQMLSMANDSQRNILLLFQ